MHVSVCACIEVCVYVQLLNRSPSWFGLWDIQSPAGKFHSEFPSAESIVKEAESMFPILDSLTSTQFFRIFKVDLSRECPFWARTDLCTSPTGSCSVCECTDDEIPTHWREKPIEHFVDRTMEFTVWDKTTTSAPLQGIWRPSSEDTGLSGPVGDAENTFLNCLSGDEAGKPVYVDLKLNPVGFTAYKGRNIWELIYKENCKLNHQGAAKCNEEDMFRRLISGLQTAVMTLSSEYNSEGTDNWPFIEKDSVSQPHGYNLDLFRWRVAPYKEWMENLYIDFSVLLRTLKQVAPIVDSCDCYTGTSAEDVESRRLLRHLLDRVESTPSGQSGSQLFSLKSELAITQMHNISRIFDCIECEKCRLHGKVKLMALQIALKVDGENSRVPSEPSGQLSELSGQSEGETRNGLKSLERNEIVGLINALHYFAQCILIVKKFERRLWVMRCVFVAAVSLVSCVLLYNTNLLLRKSIKRCRRDTDKLKDN